MSDSELVTERRGRRGPHPESTDWTSRPELRRQLRERLGFEPHGGKLRVHELERAIRRVEAGQDDNPLEALTQ